MGDPRVAHKSIEPPKPDPLVRPKLPPFNGKATEGVLITNEGKVIPLQSGGGNPAYGNYAASGHVEGKAAILIRESESSGGVVYHNNPNGTCGFCNSQVETLLPEGAKLRVVPPENAIANNPWAQAGPTEYIGNGNPIKPNPKLQ